jgi:hypothetical protein
MGKNVVCRLQVNRKVVINIFLFGEDEFCQYHRGNLCAEKILKKFICLVKNLFFEC